MAHDRYHFRSAEAVSGFDEGGHTCLPADLAIADVSVVDSSLGGRKTQFAGRWARPIPMGIIPTRSQRDDDDDDDDDDDGARVRARVRVPSPTET